MGILFKKCHIISEESLIALLANQPSEGMKILYENYSASLKKQIVRIIDNNENAEDVLQEVYIKIWKNFAKFNTTKGRLYTWMLNIAKNEAIDFLRANKMQNACSSPMDVINAADFADFSFKIIPEHIGLKELVQGLNPIESDVLNMLYFKGYTQSEVSKILRIPLGTVKSKTRKAYVQLKKQFCSEDEQLYSVA